jgi:Prokaryotic E2 family E
VNAEVQQAIEEVREFFPGCGLDIDEDGQGGAFVVVGNVDVSSKYKPTSTWCGFQITFQYPRADVYPHFIDGAIVRADGKPHGQGISTTTWRNRCALQLSRKSNRWDSTVDTAATKLAKVLEWLRSQ